MTKDKSEKKKKRGKKLKKIINKIWIWGTLGVLGIIILSGLITGLKSASDNKEKMVLEALNYYNQETLGYVSNPEESPSRSLVFATKDYLDLDVWEDLEDKLDDNSIDYQVTSYYNLKYCSILYEECELTLNEIDEQLRNSGIEAWEIYDSNNAIQYYGSQDTKLTDIDTIKTYKSDAEDVDTYLAEIKDILSQKTTVLVQNDSFGSIFLTSGLSSEINEIKDQLESVDYTLVLIGILKCGSPEGSINDMISSYDTIVNNR